MVEKELFDSIFPFRFLSRLIFIKQNRGFDMSLVNDVLQAVEVCLKIE